MDVEVRKQVLEPCLVCVDENHSYCELELCSPKFNRLRSRCYNAPSYHDRLLSPERLAGRRFITISSEAGEANEEIKRGRKKETRKEGKKRGSC